MAKLTDTIEVSLQAESAPRSFLLKLVSPENATILGVRRSAEKIDQLLGTLCLALSGESCSDLAKAETLDQVSVTTAASGASARYLLAIDTGHGYRLPLLIDRAAAESFAGYLALCQCLREAAA